MGKIHRLVTGNKVLDAFFDSWADSIEYAINTTGSAPIRVSKTPAGQVISSSSDHSFWSRITANLTGGFYSFEEVMPNDSGSWLTKPGGITGSCSEFNLNSNVLLQSIVLMMRFQAESSYRFQRGSC